MACPKIAKRLLLLATKAGVVTLLGTYFGMAERIWGDEIKTINVPPRSFVYRQPGSFTSNGQPVPTPAKIEVHNSPLMIMQYQVLNADYQRCIDAQTCTALPPASPTEIGDPAVGVSFQDAVTYAKWLSKATGMIWRLPTDREWAFAAGSLYSATEESFAEPNDDPSKGWLQRYMREAQETPDDIRPDKRGTRGPNEHGLFDLSGNVWEWTSSCFQITAVDARYAPVGTSIVNCGVRVVEGRHRTYMTYFLRDAKAGGCGLGKPPSHLGFRLVQEPGSTLWDRFRNWHN